MSDKKEEVGRGTSERGRVHEWGVREELSVTLMMTLAMGVDNVCQRGKTQETDSEGSLTRRLQMREDRGKPGREQAVQGSWAGGALSSWA